MTAAADIRQELRQWIATANKKLSVEEITDDTPIIEQRILRSIQVMDLLLFIEQLSGRSIDVEQLKPESFKNVNAIFRAFFEENNGNHGQS
jgi:acyl carrier protein